MQHLFVSLLTFVTWNWLILSYIGEATPPKQLPLSFTHHLLDDAIVFNVKGDTSFIDGFLDSRFWFERHDGNVDPLSLPFDPGFMENVSETKWHHAIYLSNAPPPPVVTPTLTAANRAFGRGMSGGKPKASTWASHKNFSARSWILPAYHPRQHRRQCLAATIASSERATRFYTPHPQQRPEYTFHLHNAIINLNGIVGTLQGYVQFREGCEHQESLGRAWHSSLLQSFDRYFSTLPEVNDKGDARAAVWSDDFAKGRVGFSGGASGGSKRKSTTTPAGTVAKGTVLDEVFVLDAVWDYNFHHALLDSVARLVYWYPYLAAHPEVYIHIRCHELYTKVSRPDRLKYMTFRQTLFSFLGLEMRRLVHGEVAARSVLAPHQLGCMGYVKHRATLHGLSQLLSNRAMATGALEPSSVPVSRRDHHPCQVPGRGQGKTKTAIVQVRQCPSHVTRKRERGGTGTGRGSKFWRCLEEEEAGHLQGQLLRALPDHWAVRTSSEISTLNAEDLVQKFSCDIQEYLEADLLLGVHGAGLTHMMFLKPGSILVELVGQFDGRMTPLCGFHGPLASVYGVHHYLYYYDAHDGQVIDVDQLGSEVRTFVAKAEAANENNTLFAQYPTQYYDKITDLYNF